MAANLNSSNDGDSDMMDVDKVSIVDEGDQEPSIKSDLAGPMTLFACIHFIMLTTIKASVTGYIGDYLEALFAIILSRDTILDNVMNRLQEFANKFALNLHICIIDNNGIQFDERKTTTVNENGRFSRTFLVFDKRYQHFYSFYVSDTNNKNQTVFPMNDTYTLRSFEDLVYSYNWPSDGEAIQQTPGEDSSIVDQYNDAENVSTAIDNGPAVNTNSQSERVIKASAVCNLLVQNIQSLILCVGSQLDSLNFSFKSSEYQLAANDLKSPETANKALHKQVQMLSKFSDLTAEILKTNHTTQISTEATTTIQNRSLTNHEENIRADTQINTKQSLPLNSQSTIYTNTSQLSGTTNNINETIKLSKLESTHQPTRARRHRNLQELRDKHCPAVQVEGADQGTPFQFKLPKEINNHKQQFYLGVHATTYDKKVHDQRLVVPINTSINEEYNLKTNNLDCLIFSNNENISDEFDPKTKGTFSKINSDELKSLLKDWTFKTVNLYQDKTITKTLIKNKKLKWSRLMFAIYIKLSDDQFERVSPPLFSDLMEETTDTQSVNTDTISPDRLCERGGQMIFIPLDPSIETKDHIYDVECNGKALDKNKFQISEKILSFESPAFNAGQKDLHVTVHNRSIGRSNTYTKPYHSHDDHPDPCGVMNED